MEPTILYAIKHIPRKEFLPEPKGTVPGRGGSWVEPVPCTKHKLRTFTKRANAARYLWTWLQGQYACHRYGYMDDYEEEVDIIPQPSRKKENMEIIPVIMEPGDKGIGPVVLLRDKATRLFLSHNYNHWNGDKTWREFTEKDCTLAFRFKSELAATRYLNQWLKGKNHEGVRDFFDPTPVPKLIPSRLDMNIELVVYSFKEI